MSESYGVALIKWEHSGLGEPIYEELIAMGHEPIYFDFDGRVPDAADVVFFYGPFGKYLPTLQEVAERPKGRRPVIAYWNTEGLPDLRLPWPVVKSMSSLRSWIGRFESSHQVWQRQWATKPPIATIDRTMTRFRYLGDFFYAYKRGWIDVFYDISDVYARYFRQHGLPAKYTPFGSFGSWHRDLQLERDIDVLWMGKRGTSRRSQLLDRLRRDLRAKGLDIYMVDGEERPFIFGDERIDILNRTKITLNLLRTWYDENSLRICMAAPNRSLFLSEPLLAHVPQYQAGIHYVSAPTEEMAERIVYYLKHDDKRAQIVQNAHSLLMNEITMYNSVHKIMTDVRKKKGQW